MNTAKDYPVTFGYGAYDGVYYTKARPHRGNDRPTPTGTPVIVGGVQIGLTGATGLTAGPHLHAQAGSDFFAQQTIDPTGHEFKGGKVVHTGTASQWGNYVIVQNTSGIFVVYAHLSKITTTVGTVLNVTQGGTNMASDKTINQVYDMGLRRAADPGGRATYRTTTDAVLVDSIYTSGERAAVLQREAAQRAQAAATAKALATAQAQLASLSSRPTKAELEAAVAKIAEADAKALKAVEKKDAEIAELNKEIAALKVVPPHVETENKTVLIGLTQSLMDFIKTMFRR